MAVCCCCCDSLTPESPSKPSFSSSSYPPPVIASPLHKHPPPLPAFPFLSPTRTLRCSRSCPPGSSRLVSIFAPPGISINAALSERGTLIKRERLNSSLFPPPSVWMHAAPRSDTDTPLADQASRGFGRQWYRKPFPQFSAQSFGSRLLFLSFT